MSIQYDMYLCEHRANVANAFDWLKENLPDMVASVSDFDTHFAHDKSKDDPEEYEAYDNYFYGGNRSYHVVENFNKAWLHHIHNNPHHWQHWVLINDEPNEGMKALPIPYNYVIEMICDWWAFSHKSGNLYEIFDWYDKHKDYMVLHDDTRTAVTIALARIRNKLDSMNN